jgi:hypothetical protein
MTVGEKEAFTVLTSNAALWYYDRRLASTSDALKSVLTAMALTSDEKQRETAKNSGDFAVISALDWWKTEDSRRKQESPRCKFRGRTAKTARSACLARIAFE